LLGIENINNFSFYGNEEVKDIHQQTFCLLIINFALVKLLRTATKEKVTERKREAQSREGVLKYIAAWLSPKSFYKILMTLTQLRL